MTVNWGLAETTRSEVVALALPWWPIFTKFAAGMERRDAAFHLLLRVSLEQDGRIAVGYA